jgi:outer membrane protein assembly factor BamB
MRWIFFLSVLIALPACDASGPGDPPGPEGREVRYRTPLVDGTNAMAALSDGSFVVAGFTDGRIGRGDYTNAYPLLLRAGTEGAFTDTTIYREDGPGDMRYGEVRAVAPFDGGLAVLAQWQDYDDLETSLENRLVLYRTDRQGRRTEVLFEQANLYGMGLLQTADGGFVLSVGRSVEEADLFKLDAAGTVAWTYRMPEVQFASRVSEAPNGDLFVLGVHDSHRFDVARLGPDGSERWRRTYESQSLQRAVQIVAADEGVAVFGSRDIPESTEDSTLVTRLSKAGAVQWRRAYAVGEMAPAATALPDGGWAFGYTEAYDESPGNGRAHVVRLDPDGEQRWQERLGPQRGTTYSTAMGVLEGGELVVVSNTGPEDIWGYGADDFDVLSAVYELEP